MIPPRAMAIINEVAQSHGVRPADILSGSRVPKNVNARWEAIWRLRAMSWGQRHPTVYKVGEWLNCDPSAVSYAMVRYAARQQQAAA